MSSPIVLLTDFGLTDHYVGVMKGMIYSLNPRATIIDLTHGIGPQDILQGAVALADNYGFFPKRSIFVCVVDPGVGSRRKMICVRSKNYFFIAPDNGLLSLAVSKEKNYETRLIANKKFWSSRGMSATFHGRDVFSPVAAHLSRNKTVFSEIGSRVFKIRGLNVSPVKKSKKEIQGRILFFDHFGNALTNIARSDAPAIFWRCAVVRAGKRNLGKICSTYSACSKNLCALFNSSERLEICSRNGSARARGNLRAGDIVSLRLS